MKIPYGRHLIDESDIEFVVNTLRGEWLTTGPLVEQFEDEISKVSGAPTICVSSGTAALHSAFAAIEIKTDDEIITPPITFIATQATAALFGAKIVFADVFADTGNINPKSVEDVISPRTRAIVAVDFAGHPADMDELRIIADKHKVYLIEDAAHSLGSKYKGKPVGSLADLTTFSFFPTKNITTGEGGAISATDTDLLEKAKIFSRQGLIRESSKFKIKTEGSWHQEVQRFGLNYRLPDILCALGISQVRKIWEFKSKRDSIFRYYNEYLEKYEWLSTPAKREYVEPNWHLYPVRVRADLRENFFLHLKNSGVLAQVNYLPAYRHPVFNFQHDARNLYPNSEEFYEREISLPLYPGLTIQELEFIVDKIEEFNFMVNNSNKI